MNIVVIPASRLSLAQISAWQSLQAADRSIDSPFFHPAFTAAVATVRGDVEVAVIEQDGAPAGFFPFQRQRGNVARPVGGRLSDFHGAVLHPDLAIDAEQLLAGCRLAAWHFDHVLAEQNIFRPYHWTASDSPYIDTTLTFEAYQADRRRAGTDELAQTLRKSRKAQRELGPVRFEFSTTDAHVLDTLLRWKAEQYARSQIVNLFSFGWTEQLLRQFLQTSDPDFCGQMSALYINEELAAVHYGIRSRHVLHSWFPAYRQDLRKVSPGSQLLVEIIRAAGAAGIERIDLGKGPEPYKASFQSGVIPLAEGSVDRRLAAQALRRLWHRTHHWVRDSRLRGPATAPWRWVRQVRDQIQYR